MATRNMNEGIAMSHSSLVIPLILAASFSPGCNRADAMAPAGAQPHTSAANDLDTTMNRAQATEHKVRHYAYAQKEAFVADMKKDLADTRAELDRLSARVNANRGEAMAEAKANLESVQEKWAQAMKRLEQAESATASTWDEVQDGFGSAYDELQDSFGNARQWLSERVEP